MAQIQHLQTIQPVYFLLTDIRYKIVTGVDLRQVLAIDKRRQLKQLVVVQRYAVEKRQVCEGVAKIVGLESVVTEVQGKEVGKTVENWYGG